MRKLMISLCALAMIAAVSGCSSKPEGEGPDRRPAHADRFDLGVKRRRAR